MFTAKRKLLLGGTLTAIAAMLVGGAALYYLLVPHDAPAQVTLGSAVASIGAAQGETITDSAPSSASTNALAGVWTLAGEGSSFLGYRVKEQLATVGTFTAVGRTTGITASLQYDGVTISGVQVTADLTSLASDSAMRDGQLKRQALETATYPTAAFVQTAPITLDHTPAEGETISATITGDLTLHGVTRSVSIPLQGQLIAGHVVVVGSLDIPFADFSIQKPSSGMVLGVEDHGLLELQLVFQKGSQS